MAPTNMANWMFNKRIMDNTIKNTNPSKIKRMQDLNHPHKKDVRKIANLNVSMHEKRKILQKAKLGKALTATIENIIIPLLNKKN